VSVGLLLREFTSNFFSLDSRFGRTLKPFLFNPGKITNAFNAGQRVRFANPIRWYLVISVIHFFLLTEVAVQEKGQTQKKGVVITGDELSDQKLDSLMALPDSVVYDSTDWPISDHYWPIIRKISEDTDLNAIGIMDSLKLNDLPFVRRNVTRQIIKLNLESETSINGYLLRNIPIIIFFILPLYAAILKLYFWKRGLYINHLIHSFHIHSFFLFLFSIIYILILLTGLEMGDVVLIGIALTVIYITVSFRKVYRVKWITAIVKLNLVGFTYSIIFTISFVTGIIISFAFY
jgi:hypothetical protein